jgi:uncharacterized protein (DUF302 family)
LTIGDAGNGIIDVRSSHSVDETVERVESILRERGLTLFALIDHSGEAERVGLAMRPTKLLIFGSPRSGTPIMVAAPSAAIDLPLKVLVWQDADGAVWVSYNSPDYLRRRHRFPDDLTHNLAAIEEITAAAGGPPSV